MAANIGINLLEVDGKATPSIQGASTSRAGFIGGTQRGVPGVVRRVTNFTEYRELFGSYIAKHNTPCAVKGFFDNGGSVAYVARAFAGTGAVASKRISGVVSGNNVAEKGPLVVKAGYRGQDDPGAWANGLVAKVGIGGGKLSISVERDGKQLELWSDLPATAACLTKVNDPVSGSRYIKLEWGGNPAPDPLPASGDFPLSLAGGLDVGSYPQEKTEELVFKEACVATLPAFETVDMQLFACPDIADGQLADMLDAAEGFCSSRGDCIYITHTEDKGVGDVQAWGDTNQGTNLYAAAYWPRIRVADPASPSGSRWMPPTGHVMGVMARTDQQRGIWKAPAGIEAQVRGALDVSHHITDSTHTDLVKKGTINAVRFHSGQGIIIDSARTMSTHALWQFLNVRLLFNFVKSSLKNSLRWVVYEPNDETTWNKAKWSVHPFLMSLWRRGAFGPGQPEDVFSIKIDAENNPPENIQQGILNLEVYFYPSRPAETIVITVGQQEGGPSASES